MEANSSDLILLPRIFHIFVSLYKKLSKYLAYIAGGGGADGWRSIGLLDAKSRRLP